MNGTRRLIAATVRRVCSFAATAAVAFVYLCVYIHRWQEGFHALYFAEMGICLSKDERDQRRINSEIERGLRSEQAKRRFEKKLLLLGPGESGKSTILKQMKIIHSSGFNDAERLAYKDAIWCNTVQSMQALLEAFEKFKYNYGKRSNQVCFTLHGLWKAMLKSNRIARNLL